MVQSLCCRDIDIFVVCRIADVTRKLCFFLLDRVCDASLLCRLRTYFVMDYMIKKFPVRINKV